MDPPQDLSEGENCLPELEIISSVDGNEYDRKMAFTHK